MSIIKEHANQLLDEYNDDMLDDILVDYALENINDQEFFHKLEKKAPNVYMLLYNIGRRMENKN